MALIGKHAESAIHCKKSRTQVLFGKGHSMPKYSVKRSY